MSASSSWLPAALRSNPFSAFLGALLALNTQASGAAAGNHEAVAQPAPASADKHSPAGDPTLRLKGLAQSDWHGIQEAHATWVHGFQPLEGNYSARTPGQQWSSRFDARGFLTTPDGGGWTWGLELRSYGFPGHEQSAATLPTPMMAAGGQRLARRWDEHLQEWYVNDARGLEHGFTLSQRPSGSRPGHPLVLDLAVHGTLHAEPQSDGQAVAFVDADGDALVTYGGLKVWDATGAMLPARIVAGTSGRLRYEIEEESAEYPVTVDPIAHLAYLKASNTPPQTFNPNPDFFGTSVAVSGETVVIGAPREDGGAAGVNPPSDENARDAGAAYVFARRNGVWNQEAYLKASNPGPTDYFGSSVAVSGDTVVVGAIHEDGSGTGVNPPDDDALFFAGAAYVFVRDGETWSQQAYLKASNAGFEDLFGSSVALSGNTLVVGAPFERGSGAGVDPPHNDDAVFAGAAYAFARENGIWRETAYLKSSNPGMQDEFGGSVALSGDLLVVGAPWEDGSGQGINSANDDLADGAGAAYIFAKQAGQWTPQAYLKASNPGVFHNFGGAVALWGDTVVVGASGEDGTGRGVNPPETQGTRDTGAAYVFRGVGDQWIQEAYLKAGNAEQDDGFGVRLSLHANTLLVGAVGERGSGTGVNPPDNNAADSAGAVYVFWRDDDEWSQEHYLKASNTELFDRFGSAVAISGDLAVVGATGEDGSGRGISPASNNDSGGAGAAYVFGGLASVGRDDPNRGLTLTWQLDRTLVVSGRGVPGQTYIIKRGTNLVDWPTVATVTADLNGVIAWTDPAPPSIGAVFYCIAVP